MLVQACGKNGLGTLEVEVEVVAMGQLVPASVLCRLLLACCDAEAVPVSVRSVTHVVSQVNWALRWPKPPCGDTHWRLRCDHKRIAPTMSLRRAVAGSLFSG